MATQRRNYQPGPIARALGVAGLIFDLFRENGELRALFDHWRNEAESKTEIILQRNQKIVKLEDEIKRLKLEYYKATGKVIK